jgi:uncharacterized protein (DUF433 family)
MREAMTAFTADQVCRLTGLSARQLAYWDREGFFPPEYFSDPRKKFGRIYSFRDVVGLRALAQLRAKRVSLQHLRELGLWLSENLTGEKPWSSLKFYVMGKQVLFRDPRTDSVTSSRPRGQRVFEHVVSEIADDVRGAIEQLRRRTPAQIGSITSSRNILHKKPIIAGTRIPTDAVWDFSQAGYDVDAIIREYPDLTREDVERALEFERSRREQKAAG